MIFLPVNLLEPGMTLARSVPSANPCLPLMVAGQRLTADSISNVLERGIQGLYVESKLTEGVVTEDFIDPEVKQELLSRIKTEYDRVLKKGKEPNYRAVNAMAESIVLQVLERDGMLFNVIDIRDYDNYTYSHSLYVGIISVLIGMNLDLPAAALSELATAGLLHDIGKLDISLNIINKPGPLTDAEYEEIKKHPSNAVSRLRTSSGYRPSVLQGIAGHHECYDGSGYPLGLEGERIHLYGRILAIADVYDALCSNRSYRKAWAPNLIIDYITSRSGTQFDPELVPALLRSVAAFPVGTLVRLSNGYVGLVTQNHPDFILRPVVRILYPDKEQSRQVDLAHEWFDVTILETAGSSQSGIMHPVS